jgi:hypothetical protein
MSHQMIGNTVSFLSAKRFFKKFQIYFYQGQRPCGNTHQPKVDHFLLLRRESIKQGL